MMHNDLTLHTLTGAGLRAVVSPFGATLVDLRRGDGPPLILGLPSRAAYAGGRTWAGAVVGRVANRIGGARAPLGNRVLRFAANDGAHLLHGGAAGLSHRDWQVVAQGADHLTLEVVSAAGAGGFPGTLTVRAAYVLRAPATLCLTLTAVTDAPTLVNLTHHPYFNLTGGATIDDHTLRVAADRYLPTDPDLIPTGAVAPVAGTRHDFRAPRRLGDRVGGQGPDTTLILADAPRATPAFAARLSAPGAPTLEVWTTEAALQVYDGGGFPQGTLLRDGRTVGRHGGVCLEPQGWTDAPNHPHFPPITLSPGAIYRHVTQYRLM